MQFKKNIVLCQGLKIPVWLKSRENTEDIAQSFVNVNSQHCLCVFRFYLAHKKHFQMLQLDENANGMHSV